MFGGLTGSMAPIIGWISAGGKISPLPLLMGAIVFFWSPPHFWTLTMYHRDDYAKAAFPTILMTEGEKMTWNKILLFTIVTIVLTGLLSFFEFSSYYVFIASLAGILYLTGTITAFMKRTDKSSKALFFLSILYLFLLFTGILLDKILV